MAGSAWIEKQWRGPEGTKIIRTGERPSKERRDELSAKGYKVAGSYLVVWREPGTTRKAYQSFSRLEDAQTFKTNTEKALQGGTYVPKVDRNQKFGTYIDKVLTNSRKIRPSTLDWYRYHFEHYVRGTPLAQRSIGDVRNDVLRAWFDESSFGNGTERAVRTLLAKALNTAVAEGILGASPLKGLEFAKKERKRVEPLPIEVVEALADAIEPRYRVAVLVAAYGGLRAGEVGGLRLQDLDLEATAEDAQGNRVPAPTIRVRQAVRTIGGRAEISDVKTDAAQRSVDIDLFLVEELRRHVDEFGTAEDGRIFTTPPRGTAEPNGLVSHFTLSKAFHTAAKRIDLNPRPRFHDLRHTFAGLLIAEGSHAKIIQQQLGHSNISTTLDTYGALFPGLGQESAQRVGARRQKVLADRTPLPMLAETVDDERQPVGALPEGGSR